MHCQRKHRSFAFENENQIIQSLVREGQFRARGMTGRSAQKVGQAQLAALGRNQAIMAESMVSANETQKHSSVRSNVNTLLLTWVRMHVVC